MDLVQNPFSPGAGTPPPALVGRQAILSQAEVAMARIKSGRSEKSALMVGLRGVGKTVLLRTISDWAEEHKYHSIFAEVPEGAQLAELIIPPIRELLLKLDRTASLNTAVKRALRVLRSFLGTVKVGNEDFTVSLDIEPEVGAADSGDLNFDLPNLFTALADAAAARHTAIALVVDEMQYLQEKEFAALIRAIHAVAQKRLPLILIGAGLPQLVGLAGRAKSYAERLFDFPEVGPLAADDAREALRKPVRDQKVDFNTEALKEIVQVTKGYPYFLQEWGYEAWNHAAKSPISLADVKAVTPKVISKLDHNFFRVRFDRLTPSEKRYLRAMAQLGPGPHRSGDIANLLRVKVQSAAPVRSGLIQKGMIYSPAHGDTAFTVPLFDEFMRRNMPEDILGKTSR